MIVTAPVIPLHRNVHHVHAVEIDENGNALRVLCGLAKPWNILRDGSQFNVHPITCDHCYRRSDCRAIRDGKAGTHPTDDERSVKP